MPPAIRKAARLMPSASSRSSPEQPEEEQDAGGDRRPSAAPWRGDARGAVPLVRLAKIGAQPGGSITTRKVTKAETNNSITAPGARQAGAGVGGDEVLREQDGDGHRADPAGHRRDRAGDLAGARRNRRRRRKSCRRLAVDADVDHGRAGLQPVAPDHLRPADRGDDDVGAADDVGQVAGAAVGDGDGAILAEQQLRHRLADDVRAADDHRLEAG